LIRVLKANFLTSSTNIKDSLDEGVSEVAFLGRSNVGKSSLINALANNKNLAKSSSTPGKTRLINFFEFILEKDEQRFPIRVVDLPGFGYAKVSKSLKEEWQKSLTQFLESRVSLRVYIHLIDSRHPNLDIDKEVEEYLKSIKRPDQKILQVFTKADKLKQKDKSALLRKFPNALMVSSSKKNGIDRLLLEIYKGVFE
jgi:GTP-binding protein